LKLELNKIHLGDSYELVKDIEDKSIDLIVIDPPYEFGGDTGGGAFGTANRDYHKQYLELYQERGKTEETERLRIIANKKNQRDSFSHLSHGFEIELLETLDKKMKATNIYIWCSKAQVRKILEYYEDSGCNIDILTWHKTNPTPTCNNTYLSDTEYCIFARRKGVKISGSYETKKKFYVTPANTEDKNLYNHPTIKPLEIIKNLIINSSEEGDVVLDCFSGSGTTCVAAKELNRQFIGIELNEEYHRISIDRLNGITASGQTSIFTDFDNLEVELIER